MQINFLADIRARMNEFTKAEKKIAEYILNNSDNVPYMVINDLAEACNVGETSIFRFCKKLKLTGYQEFRMKISSATFGENVLRPTTSGTINVDDSILDVADKILASNIMALEETKTLLNERDIQRAVNLLINAKRVFVFGVGASGIMAQDTVGKFLRITSKFTTFIDSHQQIMQASILEPDDVAIFFSYSGNTRDTIETAKMVKTTKAKTIGISKFRSSEFSKYMDVLLLCGAKEHPLRGGSLSAKMSQIYLIDILYTEYYKRTIKESKKYNDKTAQAVMNKLY